MVYFSGFIIVDRLNKRFYVLPCRKSNGPDLMLEQSNPLYTWQQLRLMSTGNTSGGDKTESSVFHSHLLVYLFQRVFILFSPLLDFKR